MESTSVYKVAAFGLSLAAYVPYFLAVVRGEARPALSSWISWCVVDVMILAGMLYAGTVAWQLVAYIVGCICIIVAMLKGTFRPGWNRLDAMCIIMVLLAIGLWGWSRDPVVAIVLSLMATTIGSVPTVVNLWKDPYSEPFLSWMMFLTGSVFGLLAVPTWEPVSALAPVWFFCLQGFTCLLIGRRFFRPVVH